MERAEAIEQLQNCKDLIKQDGQDYLDERDFPLLDMAIEALQGDMYCPNCGVRLVPENEYLEPTQTHGRLIDADALLEAVDRIGLTCDGGVDINDLEGTIQEMADADRPHGDWTPVTEQLPKIDETLPLCDQISDEVLGTDTYGNIRHVYLTNCGYIKPTFCTVEEGMSVDIVAWMPTPEPYEEVIDGKTKTSV